jgi:hypothetical protein
MANTAKEIEEVIVSLTHDEVSDLVEESLTFDDKLAFPEGGGEYDEETRVRIRDAIRALLSGSGVEMY